MSNLTSITKAIKTLNFKRLCQLLDSQGYYMEVPMLIFVKELEYKIRRDLNKNLKELEKVLVGTCNGCNKGCKAFSFLIDETKALNLFFEIKNNRVCDIYQCNSFEHEERREYSVMLSFYEEDKINFKPSKEYLIQKEIADKAVSDFNKLTEEILISIDDLVYWRDKYQEYVNYFGLNDPFSSITYKAFLTFDKLCSQVVTFLEYFDLNEYAKVALDEFKGLRQEKEIVSWLFKYKNNKLYRNFEEPKNWKETGFIKFTNDSRLIVDCHSYLNGFIFGNLYFNEKRKLLEKYRPTEQHFKEYAGINYDLATFLRLHNKYLDILPGEED